MRKQTPRLISVASNVAMEQHHGQVRKYTGEPYWNHCRAVADLVESWGGTLEMIAAAWLHDTLEDTEMTVERLREIFGPVVAGYVEELTDVYTHAAYPNLNRAQRKALESVRLGRASLEARVVKLADLTDNSSTIEAHDPGFAKTYLVEKAAVRAAMGDVLALWRATTH